MIGYFSYLILFVNISISFLRHLIMLYCFIFQARSLSQHPQSSKRVFQLYGCVVSSRDMVTPKDPTRCFNKVMHNSFILET